MLKDDNKIDAEIKNEDEEKLDSDESQNNINSVSENAIKSDNQVENAIESNNQVEPLINSENNFVTPIHENKPFTDIDFVKILIVYTIQTGIYFIFCKNKMISSK